jgi:hypothetical protein
VRMRRKHPITSQHPVQTRKQYLNPNTVELLKRIGVGVLVLGGVSLLISMVWYGTRIESLTLVNINTRGGETIDHHVIKTTVEKELEGLYLGIVPRRFAWLYPEETIKEKLIEIPRLRDLEIKRNSGKELSIEFNEYVPFALWCDTPKSEACLFIDETGYAFASAPLLTGGAFLRFSQVGQSAILRENITERHDLVTLIKLVDLLKIQGWYVSHVEIGQAKDLFLHLVGGGELKVTMETSAEQTAENLIAILLSEQFSHLKPGNFQYVDLRFGDKVYINEESITVDDTSEEQPEPVVEIINQKPEETESDVTSEIVDTTTDSDLVVDIAEAVEEED